LPWRKVVKISAYAGPRNGLRLRLDLECGHGATRVLSAAEKVALAAHPELPVSSQCIARCWVCSLVHRLGQERAFSAHHAPNGVYNR